MTPAITRWVGAALLCLVLASAHLLDGPSDIEAAQDVAADVQDAQAQAAAQRLALQRQTQAGREP